MQTFVASSVKQFRPRQQQPLKLVVMGDSIIYGFGDPEGGGWVERLRRQWMLPDTPGHVIYNLGVRGDGVKQVHERFEHEFRSRGELRNRLPDAIIFSVGVNDSARLGRPNGRNYTDFESFQTQLNSLLDQAQQLCPVLFVGMAPVDEGKMPFMDCLYYNHEDQYRYKEATRLACLKRQIPYLDIFEIWKSRGVDWWSKQILKDGLHPNVSGYKALLQEVLKWESINNLETLSLAAA
ncbi:MAG: G-D-S-L family lipolytic protein [Symploca sp. SIO3C6]|uniref:G-D-S-L family lipolytic protein n=1 Tax=Symploca sp. SIO1C4 TaxID=2607765 RepID=A0A6B3NH67_9CYAN|nr:G-D-S-L family lipolytic protein [Symploca sp. SIO3C6]NER31020.1 G-D-S-L family lipolytic protein [Symploca sp. SIO1C4]NET04352.1 G-D-S-L family lipolytic protein [Symploca sp. SIO2B6]